METKKEEHLELIAKRQPPGDNWRLVEDGSNGLIYGSLTDTLQAWFDIHQEKVSFRLDPLDSKLYVIREEEVEIKPEPVKSYSIYGDRT